MAFGTGGLVGFSGNDWASVLINAATRGWPFPPAVLRGLSHVGVIGANPSTLWESVNEPTGLCRYCEQRHSGLQAVPLEQRLAECTGSVWYYPLTNRLDKAEVRAFSLFMAERHATPYDYLGAIQSRDLPIGRGVRRFLSEDLSELFCSEMVAGVWRAMGLWQPPNVSAWNPNRLARTALSTGLVSRPMRLK